MTILELMATFSMFVFLCWGLVDITWKVKLILDMNERHRIMRRSKCTYSILED